MYSVLIVEDDPSYRDVMSVILQMEGFDVRTASSGQSCLNLLREKSSDVILCDILMPGMDGHGVLEALKGEKKLADIPFIFVSALADRADIRQGMAAGADDYLTKPFSADELLAAINGRIHRKKVFVSSKDDPTLDAKRTILLRKLTAREREVLCLVGQGATSRGIADRLGVSRKTIDVHRSNLMKKLVASNAASLARWAAIAEQL